MRFDTALREYVLERIAEIGQVDLLVGIPAYNSEETMVGVMKAVYAGLDRHDSAHDYAFLREADLAILVPRPDGSLDPFLLRHLPRARRAPHPGPAGWSAAVRQALGGLTRRRSTD